MSRKKSLLLRIRRFINSFIKFREDYIQMRLPVEKVTKDFEEMIKSKIEHNIIHAKTREATKDDADSVIDMYNRAWHSTPMPYHPLSKKKLLNLLNDPNFIFLIAKVDSDDSAFGIIYFTGNNNEIGVIGALGVVPDLQRKGLGTILGMACWEYFKNRDVKELRCKVHIENKVSYSFIKALGFEEFQEEGATRLFKF